MLPLPTTSTPSSVSGRSASPSANCAAGESLGHEGERNDRDVGVGIDEAQRGPGAVVEAALVDALRVDARRSRSCSMRAASAGLAGGVVAQRAQLRIEAAEVVDRLVARRGQDDRNARGGVRRDGDDRLRPTEGGVDRRAEPLHEGPGCAGLEGDHRRAVRDEDRRQGACPCGHWITALRAGRIQPACTQRSQLG